MKKIYLSVLTVSIIGLVACGGETKVEMPAALDSAAAAVEQSATTAVDSAATMVADSAAATVNAAVEAVK